MRGVGHRIADLHLAGGLHIRDHIADIARHQDITDTHFRGEHADFLDLVGLVRCEKFHPLATFDCAGKDADVGDHAAVGIVQGVENGGAQELVWILNRSGHAGDDRLEDFLDADARLCGGGDTILGGNTENFLQLLLALRYIGGGKVDLV